MKPYRNISLFFYSAGTVRENVVDTRTICKMFAYTRYVQSYVSQLFQKVSQKSNGIYLIEILRTLCQRRIRLTVRKMNRMTNL